MINIPAIWQAAIFVVIMYGILRSLDVYLKPFWSRWQKDIHEQEQILRASIEELKRQLTEMERRYLESEARAVALRSTQETLLTQLTESRIKMTELQKLIDKASIQIPITPVIEPITPLLVAIGSDSMLQLDLTALRAVRTATDMRFVRIEDATFAKLKQYLDNARSSNRPYDKLHLAVHASPEGILLGTELIDAVRLSEILDGINILLIAGCESNTIGSYLGIVTYVVSISEKVDNVDATLFTKAFWTEIGNKKNPTQALEAALKRSPSGMEEYIDFSW